MLMLTAPVVMRDDKGRIQISLREPMDDFLQDLTRALQTEDVTASIAEVWAWMNQDPTEEISEWVIGEKLNDATFELQVKLASAGVSMCLKMGTETAEQFARKLGAEAVNAHFSAKKAG